ncbi:hypothetical protein OIE62_25405 [Streptomyces scopuliridis]|uniref:Uncharacterized protein n=1 Tax=Streptomyces scopuliridis TaxID=452529 RepID=A0ACD4ZIT9_9ACTN|nr:hypothetical protein [Streptomyces scopuliridis]WSB34012.1 hypothetical protein OG949_14810 [Streptomyces scopuliridis]WSB98294.1 hypothetical protein OG835_15535 [Streptomyces scopuliridis]WSC08004.1 hypothetical protein OIE62_25405 [Streptomyces scopuliridis]
MDERRWRAVLVGPGDRVSLGGVWRTVKATQTDRYATGGLAVIFIFEEGRPARRPATELLPVIPRADWSLVEETAGAAPVYELECVHCADRCEPTNEPSGRTAWPIDHSGLNQGHDVFRSVVTSVLRVVPHAPGGPVNG